MSTHVRLETVPATAALVPKRRACGLQDGDVESLLKGALALLGDLPFSDEAEAASDLIRLAIGRATEEAD